MAVSVVSFSFSMTAQPEHWSPLCWVLAFLTTSPLPPTPTFSPQLNCPLARRTQLNWPLFNSSALYYLQTPTQWYGHASTTPQFLPISGDRDVSLSSDASVYESIMGFFLPRPISSANFRPRDFLSKLPLACVTSFRCISLNGIFGRVERSKHNNSFYTCTT